MRKPWRRHDKPAQCKDRVAERDREVQEAELRLLRAQRQAALAASSSAALRRELDVNGFTELLLKAWGRK